MVTLEQVEKLREYANISYDEAKIALENAEGDILQALIDLERQGKVESPQGGGQYVSGAVNVISTAGSEKENRNHHGKENVHYGKENGREGSSFGQTMNRFFKWVGRVIHKGNVNALIVEKNGDHIIKLPVTALVLLLVFAFWFVIPLMIIGLFFSFRYSFQGPDLGCDKVNDAMDSVARAAEDFKNDIRK
ncbi:DUF4342 domain-containing protein [Sinanaerobacter chloroacetimidivorans]|uniref:DUF4342 domain-containing protein n=1 Tax=Sinanaerobacter chloroacetimidivorans TaxID=2818044 RepID=A0A8J8B0K1_9FIRM|nr:DUF4342 domain-containing protein [Sinanaerobacter chloroacetimidivorans]MBR0596872.1 DUF4342 domain-containing protein [Sinanaerobacter chloroacetimidivorans]